MFTIAVRKLNESLVPEVGPFYSIDGVIYADTEPVRDLVKSSLGNVDSNNTHYDYWRSLRRVYPEFRRKDYDYYPRGRVVYHGNSDTYRVFVDKCISDKESISKIADELNLPLSKVKVDYDEHYQCSQCNSRYENISERT